MQFVCEEDWKKLVKYVVKYSCLCECMRNPFYYKWLKKLKTSIERKMRRQLLSMSNGTVDLLKDKDFVREKLLIPGTFKR